LAGVVEPSGALRNRAHWEGSCGDAAIRIDPGERLCSTITESLLSMG
jgi:hypothetical protein